MLRALGCAEIRFRQQLLLDHTTAMEVGDMSGSSDKNSKLHTLNANFHVLQTMSKTRVDGRGMSGPRSTFGFEIDLDIPFFGTAVAGPATSPKAEFGVGTSTVSYLASDPCSDLHFVSYIRTTYI